MASCKEWWEEGFRESRMYNLTVIETTINVYCEFGSVRQDNELITVFPNVDIVEWESEFIFITSDTGEEIQQADHAIDFYASTDYNANCTQEIVQMCKPHIEAAASTDDPDHMHIYSYCVCLNVTLVIGLQPELSSVRYCNTSQSLDQDDINDKLLFTYNYSTHHRVIRWKNRHIDLDNIVLKIGNVICKEEYSSDTDTVTCEEGRYIEDASLRCLYDTDSSGLINGCRSGSHLHDCDSFVCPKGTVKCPESYCIPLRFVCDGEEQCPNAEDEHGCGCEDTETEVLILHEEHAIRGPDITKLSKQLYTPNSIIRMLSIKSARLPEEIPQIYRLLQIKDKEFKSRELIDRNYECEYQILANEFLKSIKFTHREKKAILFIQSSPESEKIATLMFGNITKMPEVTIYRALESPSSTFKRQALPSVIDVVVKNWNTLSSSAVRYLPQICREAFSTSCPGSFKCSSSKMCITLDQVCDGTADCIYGDDELLCNFVCPERCICKGFAMTCNISNFNKSEFSLFPNQSRSLEISMDIKNEVTLANDLFNFPFMYLLNLSSCKIKEIYPDAFTMLSNLKILDLSNNLLTKLSKFVFDGLQRLQTLNIDGNVKLATLEQYTFQFLQSVKVLRIMGTKIRNIVSNTFAGLNLTRLDLQNNKFQSIEDVGFGNLAVEHLSFQSNLISTFNKGMFTGVSSLKSLRTPAFKFCCVRPNYLSEESCFPHKDEFSSCEDLMRISVLQTMLWLIGLCALLGNILSVIYRLKYDRKRLKLGYGIFVTNLAVADFLMGIYMIIIAVADAVFRKRYIFEDDYWRNSYWCTFAGILSTLSSEASVMFLCLITLDRILVIKYPFGQVRFDTKKAVVCSLIAWILCLMISLFPLMYTAYFMDSFYNKSGVCIALPLTRDRPPGWLYSVLVFVVFNFITFLLIAVGQWSIFMNIRKSGKGFGKGQTARKRDLTVARNLLLVVATDFLCWFPIGCTGLMAMSGRVISGDVYAWTAVFVLPVNSALNPVLYTLTAILGKKSFAPRTSEQSRITVRTALGKRFLINKYIIMRRFYVNDASSETESVYKCLEDTLQELGGIQPVIVLKISHQLAQTLLILHKSSLIMGQLDELLCQGCRT
ncbi:uncharacterized protein LOC123530741 [Mercenaria mercenaria]|uniref:uncharacterized protein LOC123530741 n=1 Tax=Mercenaria mercenaria TaxID=6596 RepID=UPI00234F7561|nr:uncharacterized protein LOC123530741 [Mercenaria mercenaria]